MDEVPRKKRRITLLDISVVLFIFWSWYICATGVWDYSVWSFLYGSAFTTYLYHKKGLI